MRILSLGGVVMAMVMMGSWAMGDPLMIDVSTPPSAPKMDLFKMGTAQNPDGHSITMNSATLMKDGKPWLPVMGEFHYSRYPASEWRDELLKMKAGGIQIVSTYVFWIHHEEEEGKWDWSGDRSLRDFVKTCQEVQMPLVVRMGPWCHGEVRNGGLPDWILPMGRRLRTQDPEFMGKVKILYGQIAEQLKGLLWKDGGPVIGVQFDNEYRGRAEYLLDLKKIARDAGIDVPIYTRTGWPNLTTAMPLGEIVPLYGAYAEGFWDRVLTEMPGKYWFAFVFSKIRTDASIGTDVIGQRDMQDDPEAANYPFLSCELGGGMMNSYHRRILIDPRDIESVALVKTGSGSNMPGYYMYHGGTNPQGKLTTLMEAQNTAMTNYNDMPVKNYDFQAPLGEFGQVRGQYHGLRLLHMFLADWGSELAMMPATVPTGQQRKNDADTLRYAIRSDGKSGFLFVNNYQRLLPMPAKKDVQFDVKFANGSVKIPNEPVNIPADSYFFWPVNMDLGGGLRIVYATAQPVCRIGDTIIFSAIKGIPSEFDIAGFSSLAYNDEIAVSPRTLETRRLLNPSMKPMTLTGGGKKVNIILLDNAMARETWKGTVGGKEGIFISKANLLFDGGKLRMQSSDPGALEVSMFEDGTFKPLAGAPLKSQNLEATIERIKPAGPLRQITMGSQHAAEEPSDADFDQAAVYRIKLPAGIDQHNALLRLSYVGDVARIYLDGQFVLDDFYNGRPMDFGLKRYGPDIEKKELLVKILPLRKNAPIYLAKEAQPDFGGAESIEKVTKVELVEQFEASVSQK